MNYFITNFQFHFLNNHFHYRTLSNLDLQEITDLVERGLIRIGEDRLIDNKNITLKGIWCLFIYNRKNKPYEDAF